MSKHRMAEYGTVPASLVLLVLLNLGCSESHSPVGVLQAEETKPTVVDPDSGKDPLRTLVIRALNRNTVGQAEAIRELRNHGRAAVVYMMAHHELNTSPHWAEVLDKVAQQKDARSSGLYWYTDLDLALAQSKREKKPVLSLCLLGKLTDELSCANSRFFRTSLYPNPQVRELLQNRFILHWQSMRPVPVITIDFGDGRKLERTITGNSLHLVLDQQGRAIDVLPGLYTAATFIQVLQSAGPAAVQMSELEGENFKVARRNYHNDERTSLEQSWDRFCKQLDLPETMQIGVDHPVEVWKKIADKAIPNPSFSREVARVMTVHATAEAAGKLAFGKNAVEKPMLAAIDNVSRLFREDSVRNEYFLHATIHKWFLGGSMMAANQKTPTAANGNPGVSRGGFGGGFGGQVGGGIGGQFGGAPQAYMMSPGEQQKMGVDLQREQLVDRIYSELFLSPINDPWYGLSKPDVYSAIHNDGRIDAFTQNARR